MAGPACAGLGEGALVDLLVFQGMIAAHPVAGSTGTVDLQQRARAAPARQDASAAAVLD